MILNPRIAPPPPPHPPVSVCVSFHFLPASLHTRHNSRKSFVCKGSVVVIPNTFRPDITALADRA